MVLLDKQQSHTCKYRFPTSWRNSRASANPSENRSNQRPKPPMLARRENGSTYLRNAVVTAVNGGDGPVFKHQQKRINGSSTCAPLLLTPKLMWLTQQMARRHANRPSLSGRQQTLQELASYLCCPPMLQLMVNKCPRGGSSGTEQDI